MRKIFSLVKLLRLKHCIKNILIFLPLFFSGNLFDVSKILNCVGGFISFTLIASSIYIINDVKDVEKDRLHPTKRNRPIASGDVKIPTALCISVFCFLFSVGLEVYFCLFSKISFFILLYLLVYFVLNVSYSFGLKNIPIIDIVILMSGFLIRILLGAKLADTYVSSWLYLTVISGAFYFGLGKRRNEIKATSETNTRSVLAFYNFNFLDKFMYMCLSMTCIFYALWAKEHINKHLIWTVPVIIVICMQYSLDIEGESDGDPVEVILKDKKLISFCLILLFMLLGIMYFL